jgi:hypothetical protein
MTVYWVYLRVANDPYGSCSFYVRAGSKQSAINKARISAQKAGYTHEKCGPHTFTAKRETPFAPRSAR